MGVPLITELKVSDKIVLYGRFLAIALIAPGKVAGLYAPNPNTFTLSPIGIVS